MSIINVSTTAGLLAAVKTAQAGDTISLAAGTYSGINLSSINPLGNITITSADASRPAVFTDLMVNGSSNLTFSNLEFSIQAGNTASYPFQVYGSKNIVLDNLDVHGTPLTSTTTTSGLMIRNSTNVSLTNSDFHDVRYGVNILNNTGLRIADNSFHDIREDGIRGGGNSNVVIAENLFTDFYPNVAAGDHGDAIQFWTTNTTKSAENISITGNVVVRGDGGLIQGIFMRDEVGSLPYLNVTITDNLVVGTMWNGIAVRGVSGGLIANNTVAGSPDQQTWIRTQDVQNVAIQDNAATAYVIETVYKSGTLSSAVPAGNTTIATPLDGGTLLATAWLKEHNLPGGMQTINEVLAFLGMPQIVSEPISLPVLEAQSAPAPAPETVEPVVINGGTTNDILNASMSEESIVYGWAGNDTINGFGAGSKLYGGTGDDTYILRGPNDLVFENAGEGKDTVSVSFDYQLGANLEDLWLRDGAIRGEGNDLNNRIIGNAADNVINGFGGADLLQGGAGNDVLDGGIGNDDLRGEDGIDRLLGGDGADNLYGGAGYDILQGGNGNDLLEGGAGNDQLWGGAGNDIFRFRGDSLSGKDVDRILDFQVGTDKIDLSPIDANSRTSANDAFKFIGGASFSGKGGELRVTTNTGSAHFALDVNGDRIADMTIIVENVTTLNASNFIL